MQLGLEGSWSRALLGGCGRKHIAPAKSVPCLGAKRSWSTDPAELPEKAAVEQGEDGGASRLCKPKSLWCKQ